MEKEIEVKRGGAEGRGRAIKTRKGKAKEGRERE